MAAEGARILVKYVNFRALFDAPGTPQLYSVEPSLQLVGHPRPVIYQDHGLAVVAFP